MRRKKYAEKEIKSYSRHFGTSLIKHRRSLKKSKVLDRWKNSWIGEFFIVIEPIGIALAAIGLIITCFQLWYEFGHRQEERNVRNWQILASDTTSITAKIHAIEYLLNNKIDISGIDISCKNYRDRPIGNFGYGDRGLRFYSYIQWCKNYSTINNMNLSAKQFKNTELNQVSFAGLDLVNSNFDHLNMDNASFNKTNLKNASFKNTTISDSEFVNAGLFGVDFSYANLIRTDFEDPDFYQYNLIHNNTISFHNATLSGVRLINAVLNDSSFVSANLELVDFSNTLFFNTNFENSTFFKVNISDADLTDTSGLTQDMLNNAWAWEDALPELPKGLQVGIRCPMSEKKSYNFQLRTGCYPGFGTYHLIEE
jgi:uncharacterized protein YjbI with pentapeptide repeats